MRRHVNAIFFSLFEMEATGASSMLIKDVVNELD